MRTFFLALGLAAGIFTIHAQPTISFTFDDGVTNDMPNYTFEQWNNMLLQHLDSAKVKAVFFVTGSNKLDAKGKLLLASWNNKGHAIGNHTYLHNNYNSKSSTVEGFSQELMRTDSLIHNYSNFVPLFRFPYLKEGDTRDKIDSFRRFMEQHHYRNGHVTVDASDWYIDSRLRKRLAKSPDASLSGFRKYYLDHLYNRAMYYDSLGKTLTGRNVHHTLLLHHNLTSALFLGDLIRMFKTRGWKVIDALDAYQDPIFLTVTTSVPAGESLLWSMAKQSGQYENVLPYPAEDSQYEQATMDALGL